MVRNLNHELETKIKNLVAGNTANCIDKWKSLTSDNEILDAIRGLHIDNDGLEFDKKSKQFPLSESQQTTMDNEIEKLLAKRVIATCEKEPNDYFSPIFLKEKPDGGQRVILNLKKLNAKLEKIHFKMDTIFTITKLIRKGCYFTKIDIKDAYFSIKVLAEHTKYLKFKHRNISFKFLVLPNGYIHGPRKFSKIMKVPLAILRINDVDIIAYLDDCLVKADNFMMCFNQTIETIRLLQDLGFAIHPQPKSVLIPTNRIEFLGFILNSISMKISLTNRKTENLKMLCSQTMKRNQLTIRDLASLLGKITSCFPATKYGRLHYRGIERLKTSSLKNNGFNFNKKIHLNDDATKDIAWWHDNVEAQSNDLWNPNPSLTIKSDACSYGWGGVIEEAIPTGGAFSEEEMLDHINVKELKAALFCLESLAKYVENSHIKLLSDNSTTVACINKFGTSKSLACDLVAQDIWRWAIARNNHITSAHIPGKINLEADEESRRIEIHTEWQIKPSIFQHVCRVLEFCLEVDLFASRLNTQLPKYMSYRPDPGCIAIDSLSENWTNLEFYAFPPFAIIPRTIQKISHENAKGILIVPDWPTQPWYIRLKSITINSTILFPRRDLLRLPSDTALVHPMARTLHLRCCLVDGM